MKVADSKSASGRTISIQDVDHDSEYCSNLVRTAKYSFISFIPVNLFNQFQRVANIYFLFIAILQFIPGLSPTHWSTTVAPLVGVLTVNAVKEGYDDYFRHKSDKEVNNREVKVLRGTSFVSKFWKELQVGDIIRIHHSEQSPADIAILQSGHEESIAYVETSNLDGETALKLKMSVFKDNDTQEKDIGKEISTLKGHIKDATVTAELPNNDLYRFKGVFKSSDGTEVPLDPNNLILRGSSLKNTNWVMGVVVYAGRDSKILLNMTDAPHKVSQLERHMNVLVAAVFSFLGIVSIILGLISNSALANLRTHWYMESEDKWPSFDPSFINIVVQSIRFIILLNQFIPISLYVTLELVKVIQCYFLNVDRRMYHKETDTRFNARTTSLNEELGQIEYILSDKTGTLTQNVMEFVGCSIAGEVFDANDVTSNLGSVDGDSVTSHVSKQRKTTGYHSISASKKLKKYIDGIYGDIKASGSPKDPKRVHVDMFMKALVLCNTVTTIDEDIQKQLSNAGKDVGQYMADSPDEEALVEGVASMGYTLKGRTKDTAYITCPNGDLAYKQLALLGFSSERKRMSAIYKTPEGKIVIVSKGADQVMLPRCRKDNQVISTTKNHLKGMGMSGYRTLCVAYKEISEEDFAVWNDQYHKATLSMENRTQAIEKCAELIENDLILLGATAVEDKLQDGVPETISMLLEAGLHVWILTGDKLETSLSVALSSMLLTDIMPVVIFRDDQLIDSDSEVARKKNREIINSKIDETETYKRNDQKLGLVIEGGALTTMLKPEYQESLLRICKLCNSVICCRMSPLQKAEVTKLVKNTGAVTLAIGDGANDAGMIQSAHVGVGISGREGRAAVLASDFALAQFRFLSRLLLVHGRWSFLRNREVVLYAFYKNIAYCFPNILMACITGVSTQPLYSAAFIATHNVCWTSLPTLANATLEQDLNPRTVVNNPDLYKITSKADRKNFFKWTAYWLSSAFWHALVIFWVPFLSYINHDGSGNERGMWFMGAIVYTCAVIVVNLKLAMRTRYWTWITHFLTWGSIVVFFVFLLYISQIWKNMDLFPELFGVAAVFSKGTFWLVILLATVMCLCYDVAVDSLHRTFYPNMQHFFQQLEYLGGGKQPVSSLQSTPIHTPRQSRSNSLALSADSMDSVPSLPSVIQVISS